MCHETFLFRLYLHGHCLSGSGVVGIFTWRYGRADSHAVDYCILAVMEISLSFDNAVVNASVLKGWDEFWKKIFLTVGILIAVFDALGIPEIVIVAVTADGMMEVIRLALYNPEEYSARLMAHRTEISAFGGIFLLLVFLNFVFDDKDVHWFNWLSRLAKLGKGTMSVFVALIILMIAVSWANADQSAAVLIAGVWGIFGVPWCTGCALVCLRATLRKG